MPADMRHRHQGHDAHDIDATLNIAGDSAGTKNTFSEFSIPMQAAATATSIRNGAISRELDRELELARHRGEAARRAA